MLARAQEYQADRWAARVAGSRNAAQALISLWVKGDLLRDGFWPEIYRRADLEASPTVTPHRFMPERINRTFESRQVAERLEAALKEKTGTADTHPALADRLNALGEEPEMPPAVSETAAQCLLSARLPEFVQHFDRSWQEAVAESWKQRHEYVQAARARLAELENKATAGELSLREAWDRACYTEEFSGSEAALPLYREVLHRAPDDAYPLFAVGRVLLSKGDAGGLPLLQRAMELDGELSASGAELIAQFHATQGRKDEAENWWQRALRTRQTQAQAAAERESLTTSDRFLPHGPDADAIAALNAQLANYREIAKAYLVRKALSHEAETRPLFVLGVAYPSWHFRYKQRKAFAQKLAAELSFPGESFVLVVNGSAFGSDAETEIGRKMRKVKGSLIYRR